MRWVNIGIIVFIFSLSFYYYLDYSLSDRDMNRKSNEVYASQVDRETKSIPENFFKIALLDWIGKSEVDLVGQYGTPLRKDPSPYGYEWWVYKEDHSQYVQFGVLDHKIIMVYAIGDDIDLDTIRIGQTYDELVHQFVFNNEITFENGHSFHTFYLNEEDLSMRPLIKLSNGHYMQLYFDTFTDKLSSVRILTGDVLLMHRDYETFYRGSLPEQPNITNDQWKLIEEGMEKQIVDITNVVRVREGTKPVMWEDAVREVAYAHSKDMKENNYFSHFGPGGDGLKERLAEKEILYRSAGENIAAQYVDAPAAMEGWLNSESHREALLSDHYTHIGVGVYRLYYTQNFLEQSF